ncbi:MAG: response regulator [Opitutus sp.]|nr:response regulator [Opitutus sp.]
MDGIAAARAMRERFSLPVVFLTAFAEEESLQRAKLAEPFGYIVKPFDEPELRTEIEMGLHQHQTELRLQESEARYRAVVDFAADAIITADQAGKIVGWNQGAARIFGYTEEEVSGRCMTLPMPARFHARHLAGMTRVQGGGGAGGTIGKRTGIFLGAGHDFGDPGCVRKHHPFSGNQGGPHAAEATRVEPGPRA